MSVADVWITFGARVESAAFEMYKVGDLLAEMDKEPSDTSYAGPCVCDVCPCPLVIVHRSGTGHCWNCAAGHHWTLPPFSPNSVALVSSSDTETSTDRAQEG